MLLHRYRCNISHTDKYGGGGGGKHACQQFHNYLFLKVAVTSIRTTIIVFIYSMVTSARINGWLIPKQTIFKSGEGSNTILNGFQFRVLIRCLSIRAILQVCSIRLP